LTNNGTLQGVVVGRVTRGSGLTGFDEPTVGGGAITTCAGNIEATAKRRKREERIRRA
jgi:hypothetical protein